jgi:hypothetical protein
MELANPPSESLAPWMPATSSVAPAERVRTWSERAHRVYPETTQKAGAATGLFGWRSANAKKSLAIAGRTNNRSVVCGCLPS